MKTHFAVKPPMSADVVSACGVGRRIDANVHRVDCLNCQRNDKFILAKDEARMAEEAAYWEQSPRKVRNVWDWNKFYVCDCGNDLWRERPRGLFSYHFVCSACHHSIHPPTETGMCT